MGILEAGRLVERRASGTYERMVVIRLLEHIVEINEDAEPAIPVAVRIVEQRYFKERS